MSEQPKEISATFGKRLTSEQRQAVGQALIALKYNQSELIDDLLENYLEDLVKRKLEQEKKRLRQLSGLDLSAGFLKRQVLSAIKQNRGMVRDTGFEPVTPTVSR